MKKIYIALAVVLLSATLIWAVINGSIIVQPLIESELVISPALIPKEVSSSRDDHVSFHLDATKFPILSVEGKNIDFSKLSTALIPYSKDAVVDILASEDQDYTVTIQILDVLKNNGYSKINLSTKPIKGSVPNQAGDDNSE